MWGDGKQTRSFTFIDDCVEGILRITKSDFKEPLNLGSSEMVTPQVIDLKKSDRPFIFYTCISPAPNHTSYLWNQACSKFGPFSNNQSHTMESHCVCSVPPDHPLQAQRSLRTSLN